MRVQFKNANSNFLQATGTATPAEDYGYTVEWDDGYVDSPQMRWYFEGTGIFDLEVID